MKLPRLGVRWRLLVTIVGAVAVALAVAVVAFSVLLGQRLSSSATSLAKAQAEAAAIDSLRAARQNIERMLLDLQTTKNARVVRAKADIDKAIVVFQASLDDFRRKFTTPSEKK